MNKIYLTPILINFDYFSAYSPVPDNFNWEDIRPFVKVSEEIWIAPILGEKLYRQLLKEVADNNISDVNSTLLLQIYQLEAIAIVYEALPFLVYQVSEKGIVKKEDDKTKSIDVKEFSEIKNSLRTKLEVLKESLKNFLEENRKCYPAYIGIQSHKPNEDFRIFGSNKNY